jgi:hypothetical protein
MAATFVWDNLSHRVHWNYCYDDEFPGRLEYDIIAKAWVENRYELADSISWILPSDDLHTYEIVEVDFDPATSHGAAFTSFYLQDLPWYNDEFGLVDKEVTACAVVGGSPFSVQLSPSIFFEKDAENSLWGAGFPNWYYYWTQLPIPQEREDMVYVPDLHERLQELLGYEDANATAAYIYGGCEVYVGPIAGVGGEVGYGASNNPYDKIDCFGVSMFHEWGHLQHYANVWGGVFCEESPTVYEQYRDEYDLDHDRLLDYLEPEMGFDPNDATTIGTWMDSDVQAQRVADSAWVNGQWDSLDWSYPGHQWWWEGKLPKSMDRQDAFRPVAILASVSGQSGRVLPQDMPSSGAVYAFKRLSPGERDSLASELKEGGRNAISLLNEFAFSEDLIVAMFAINVLAHMRGQEADSLAVRVAAHAPQEEMSRHVCQKILESRELQAGQLLELLSSRWLTPRYLALRKLEGVALTQPLFTAVVDVARSAGFHLALESIELLGDAVLLEPLGDVDLADAMVEIVIMELTMPRHSQPVYGSGHAGSEILMVYAKDALRQVPLPIVLDARASREPLDPRVALRMDCIQLSLGDAGKYDSVEACLRACEFGTDRIWAAEALGSFGDARAIPSLVAALRDTFRVPVLSNLTPLEGEVEYMLPVAEEAFLSLLDLGADVARKGSEFWVVPHAK